MFTASRFLAIAAALVVAVPLAAQQASLDSTARPIAPAAVVASANPVAAAPVVGPMLHPDAVSARMPATARTAMPMYANGDNSQNVALMVVGGAGLIVGAVIGGRSGTIVMLGGGILGLVGLFRYLQ
ncbi:MAG TPA: hypothetical protein VFT41_06765 [Gemmatimonadaceae bacterium]|nr:hypothetical protein [Gemmatimonadaceae bacterium]